MVLLTAVESHPVDRAGAPALEARALRKTYRLSKTNTYDALRGVDLQVPRGDFAAIVGPSGSGKSTLMNMLATIDRPTSGHVLVDGVDTSTLSEADLATLRNRKIGLVFQAYNLIGRMSATANVALPLIAQEVPAADRVARAHEALTAVGLGHRLENRPVEMSGGEQQRVAIARALVTRPSILLADEPTGNLDTANSRAVMELLERIHADTGLTVLIITHDNDLARQTRRVITLRDGAVESVEVLS